MVRKQLYLLFAVALLTQGAAIYGYGSDYYYFL